MSIESAKAFFTRMNGDEGFRNKILELEDFGARLACAKAEGFAFTREEIDGVAVEAAVGGQEGGGPVSGDYCRWYFG